MIFGQTKTVGWLRAGALAVLLVLAAACSSEEPAPTADAGPTVDAGLPLPPAPTWHGEVAPIIAEHCQRCHEQGGIAPFPLMNYAQSSPMAGSIAAASGARRMPPFLADNSGDCNTWRDANWLSNDKLQILADWAATGAQEGEPKAAPTPPELPSIENPDLTVTMSEVFTPDDQLSDEYRCFVLDPQLNRTTYVTEYEVVPGDSRVVHHVILYSPNNVEAEAQAEELANGQARAGYSCYGGARIPSSMIAAWAPGTGATAFPQNTGLRLREGGKLVMQIHYNMSSGSFPDQTAIKLRLADQVDSPAIMSILGRNSLRIPPGLEDHSESWTVGLRDLGGVVPLQLWGVLPHMHAIGTKYRLERLRDGDTMCLMDVRRWDFNWQFSYFLEEPIDLQPTDSLRTTCRFDSRGRTEVTTFGEDTSDEMCLAIVFVTVAN